MLHMLVRVLTDITITFTGLWANSAEDKLMIFFLFSLENRIDNSCKLSLLC